MAKVMLVEDDNNLREIYEARLIAEGYEIVSAHDGEEALALAIKEQPDLIISDVMMPKISGFDMLDILRSTTETKNAKVIMMTALSQAEDKERAGKLGADRYLVKSQVTLEDVVRAAKEVLSDGSSEPSVGITTPPAQAPAAPPIADAAPVATPIPVTSAPAEPVASTPATPSSDTPSAATPPTEPPATSPAVPQPEPITTPTPPPTQPVADTVPNVTLDTPVPTDEPERGSTEEQTPVPSPFSPTAPASTPAAPVTSGTSSVETADAQTADEATASIEDQIKNFIATAEQVKNNAPTDVAGTTPPAGPAPQAPAPAATHSTPPPESPSHKKVILPINDLSNPGPNLDELLAKEEAASAVANPDTNSVITPGGEVVGATPAPAPAEETTEPPHKPGDKIDPNSIAL